MNSAGVAAASKAARCCSFRDPRHRADQDKIIVHQSLRNGDHKNQMSALAFIVPRNSSFAAANREDDLDRPVPCGREEKRRRLRPGWSLPVRAPAPAREILPAVARSPFVQEDR